MVEWPLTLNRKLRPKDLYLISPETIVIGIKLPFPIVSILGINYFIVIEIFIDEITNRGKFPSVSTDSPYLSSSSWVLKIHFR